MLPITIQRPQSVFVVKRDTLPIFVVSQDDDGRVLCFEGTGLPV